jgi:acetylornithine/N-succinyldiaminopimelate aminotransferase
MNFDELKAKDHKYIANTYARFDLWIESGKNAVCQDENGNEYVDFGSGIGVNVLGYSDPNWAEAVSKQLFTLQHTSNLYYTKPAVELAEKLCKATGFHKVFFANSGAEANEGMIKVARKYSFDRYGEGRSTIISLKNSFHGRTVTTLSATGQEHYHEYFFPFTGGFLYAPMNDVESLKSMLDDSVCAVMVELIQGEGGVLAADPEFIRQVRAFCDEHDLLLLIDEVQTGIGHTGYFLASQAYGVQADIMSLAKGLGGGLPIGAVLLSEKTEGVLSFGDHGSTFGANPAVCAGANFVVDQILQNGFLEEVQKKGSYIREKLSQMDGVAEISGLGLMIGILPKEKKAGDLAKECLQKGLLILTAKDKLRMLPPLTITYEEIDRGLAVLESIL